MTKNRNRRKEKRRGDNRQEIYFIKLKEKWAKMKFKIKRKKR